MTDRLAELSATGVAIWLDDLSRDRLASGAIDRMRREQHLVGITSNPTIFAKAVADAKEYDWQLRDLAVRGVSVEEAARMLTTYDIRWACDVMRPAYDTSAGVDGRVSLEVDPRLAYDTEKTIAEAKALWWLVDRPNLFIKIPATEAGLPAITACLAEGISVNVTLIFSLERYGQVMDAFLAGLEQARDNGHDLSTIASVASFFVSRVDTEVDKRLDAIGGEAAAALRGKAAVANARLAHAAFEEYINTPRWESLAADGARPQRPLWASTGVKNPAYSPTLYVDELVTRGTVNTMPEKTIDAVAASGKITGDTVRENYENADAVMRELKQVGIDYDDVVKVLEDEGVEKFEASWNELLATVAGELRKA